MKENQNNFSWAHFFCILRQKKEQTNMTQLGLGLIKWNHLSGAHEMLTFISLCKSFYKRINVDKANSIDIHDKCFCA